MSILDNIFGKTKFWVNFFENIVFGKKNWNLDTGYIFHKILIWGQNFRKFRFLSAFSDTISILVKNKRKFRCWSKFLDNLNFGQNFRKSWFYSKVSKNLAFRQYFQKISMLVKISENVDFGKKFLNISILVKFFWKSRFRSKFLEFSIYLQTNLFLGKIFKLLNPVKIVVNYLDFCQNFRKSWFWSQFIKFLLLIKIFENVDVGQNFRKILISVKIFLKSWHWSKFSKNLDFSQDYRKSRFCQKFRKLCQTLAKFSMILILFKIFDKSWFP